MLHAQKVFVDAYLSSRQGYELWVPRVSLTELYAERLAPWFAEHGVELHMESSVREIDVLPHRVSIAVDRTTHECGAVVVAVPWTRVRQILAPRLVDALPELAGLDQIDAAPITGVHLWFDREITPLPHAALVDMLSQWLFRRGTSAETDGSGAYYYQVVISASRHIAGRDRGDVVTEICAELRDVFPPGEAKLLRWKIVTDSAAVFSVRPGIEALRPGQATRFERLYLAGDWTAHRLALDDGKRRSQRLPGCRRRASALRPRATPACRRSASRAGWRD